MCLITVDSVVYLGRTKNIFDENENCNAAVSSKNDVRCNKTKILLKQRSNTLNVHWITFIRLESFIAYLIMHEDSGNALERLPNCLSVTNKMSLLQDDS